MLPLIKGWEESRDLHPFSQSSILLLLQSAILLRKLPLPPPPTSLWCSFMFFLLLLWPLKILISLMTMKHHHWSRKAHTLLLTDFKLILLTHMMFFKLLLLDGEGGQHRRTFLQLFSLCTCLYKTRSYRTQWTKDMKFKQRTVLTQNPSEEKEPEPELFWWFSSHHLPHPVHQGPHSWNVGIRWC